MDSKRLIVVNQWVIKEKLSKFKANARATVIGDRSVNIRLSSGDLQDILVGRPPPDTANLAGQLPWRNQY